MSASERLSLAGPSLSHTTGVRIPRRHSQTPPRSLPPTLSYPAHPSTLTARRQLRARRVSRPPHALHAHDGVGVLRPQVLPRPARGRLPPGGLGLEHGPRGGHGAHRPGRFRRARRLLVQLAEEGPEQDPGTAAPGGRERAMLCGKGWGVRREEGRGSAMVQNRRVLHCAKQAGPKPDGLFAGPRR